MDYENIIAEIVGEEYKNYWFTLKPKIYYKDNEPFGLIGSKELHGITYLATTAINTDYDFTIGMIRDIINFYNKGEICLLSGTKDRENNIRKGLSRFKFRFEYNNDILYAYGGKNV